ncbi:MAG TPA: glycosyltransferase family 4 protein [Gaiellaceae bacterium]|nr:glycosyltransferase family 4 protein [Gaiellaceae bacterium]
MSDTAPSVVFVSPFAQLAGAERFLELMLENMPRSLVRRVVFLQEGPFVARAREAGHPITVLPTSQRPPGLVRSAWRLRRLLENDPPDLVHANGVKAALVCALALLGKPTPLVWMKHDLSFDGSLARPLARRCRLVIGVSSATLAVFGPKLRHKLRRVPHGLPPIDVDRDDGRAELVRLVSGDDDAPVVGLVGRLYRMKGQHELVEVVPEVLERVPDVRFAFLGGVDPNVPEYAEAVRRRVDQLGITAAVSFLGHRDDATLLMSGCDLIAIPSVPAERSNREAFSLVALEALLVGTPVVAYAEGGLPEVLGSCALLAPTGDRAALRDAIVRALQDAQLRRSLADCGRQRALTKFRLERMVESILECYREASSPARGT